MNKNVKTNIRMRLLSPLSHFGDERMGTMQIMRTMKIFYNDEMIDVPVFSGNALRGELRRIAMKDYLERIGIAEEGISAKLYYMLFTGGALTSGTRYNEIGEKRRMREMCPPLSLFGTAIGDQIPEGKMKVGISYPICQETADYTGIESNLSFYDMLEDVFYTRRDDLKSKEYNITEEEKHENPIQMKYEMQCLSAGTELYTEIVLENATEAEEACLNAILEKFKEMPYIGGKSAAGHGKVDIKYDALTNSDIYYDYLEQRKEEMRNWIREVEQKI
ncbi:CRISPR type IV/AFERR-associated protein Csf2 [Alkalithermobacter thermoalcaliphilus JW-YL-7 = DSM 7308]|uniref:CRISPR type IV/AFERR-associated protein Csf2 n=1 Tax=Alkalithermobacter thermoalcaliphilus JW-YL-7 = DSM 7308 TaxID=1121328 RepID=A0A150FR06_CLOPD|nr:protein of unknown function DUF324 [[Clostridium] paradoxum JW-YL-7 = DSM 7308]SHL13161.1 CRISPR type IV/AFERR-associated protein Csf2 [[Clostridium] paradoxum JW-YL-7 = DSM 7308]